jgi:hypothetical protein
MPTDDHEVRVSGEPGYLSPSGAGESARFGSYCWDAIQTTYLPSKGTGRPSPRSTLCDIEEAPISVSEPEPTGDISRPHSLSGLLLGQDPARHRVGRGVDVRGPSTDPIQH